MEIINLKYADFKINVFDNDIKHKYVLTTQSSNKYYKLFGLDSLIMYKCEINSIDDSLDISDYEGSYKNLAVTRFDILDNKGIKKIVINEENTATGGRFQTKSIVLDIPASAGWKTVEFSWPININILCAHYGTDENDEGNELMLTISDGTIIGAVTSSVAIDDTVLNVNSTVLDNAQIGYHIKIGTDDFGIVIEKDAVNSTITVENGATATHNPGDYVSMAIEYAPYLKLHGTGIFTVATSKIGASHLPKNTVLKLHYNNINETAKIFVVNFEYLY